MNSEMGVNCTVFALGMVCGALVLMFAMWFANIHEAVANQEKAEKKESEDR